MMSNAYFLAKFRFDTAENAPTKNLQNFRNKIAKFADLSLRPLRAFDVRGRVLRRVEGRALHDGGPVDGVPGWRSGAVEEGHGVSKIGKFCKFLQILAGSFSAVSKRNFARQYAFDRILASLLSKSLKFCEIVYEKNLRNFDENLLIFLGRRGVASQALSFESAYSLLPLVEQRARVHPLFATPPGIVAAV